MCGVLCDRAAARLVVSDGKIMQTMPITLEILNADEWRGVIIPVSIIKNAKIGEKITIYKSANKYIIKTATESAEEIEGNYPNWQNVLKSFKLAPVATFSKKEITALQKTADKITKGMTPRLFVYNSTSGAPILCAVDFDYNKKNNKQKWSMQYLSYKGGKAFPSAALRCVLPLLTGESPVTPP